MAKRHKSAVKRHKQSLVARERNRAVKSELRSAIKAVKQGPGANAESYSELTSLLDKAVKRNVMHKNTASRKKSRLAKMLNKKAQPQ
ncbi:MAG: 30S ribosomal protein S20 [candidate division Zixibacteria bacterium]|nr:30S ribosomal protein S20 [candidate division Zixibacteria bacterium]